MAWCPRIPMPHATGAGDPADYSFGHRCPGRWSSMCWRHASAARRSTRELCKAIYESFAFEHKKHSSCEMNLLNLVNLLLHLISSYFIFSSFPAFRLCFILFQIQCELLHHLAQVAVWSMALLSWSSSRPQIASAASAAGALCLQVLGCFLESPELPELLNHPESSQPSNLRIWKLGSSKWTKGDPKGDQRWPKMVKLVEPRTTTVEFLSFSGCSILVVQSWNPFEGI